MAAINYSDFIGKIKPTMGFAFVRRFTFLESIFLSVWLQPPSVPTLPERHSWLQVRLWNAKKHLRECGLCVCAGSGRELFYCELWLRGRDKVREFYRVGNTFKPNWMFSFRSSWGHKSDCLDALWNSSSYQKGATLRVVATTAVNNSSWKLNMLMWINISS